MNQKLVALLVILVFCGQLGEAFILRLPPNPWKKCYQTEHSPDKTLEAKMGFLKKEQYPCLVKFSVVFKDGADRVVESIHEREQSCQEGRFRDTYMVKHTPSQQVSEFVTGYYQICVEVIQNTNLGIFVEVFIGEKLNPIIYEHSDHPLPLVEAQELLDLDLTVQSIRRGLVKSQQHAKAIRKSGDGLDFKIQTLMSVNDWVNIVQIIILTISGAAWIYLIRRLKRSQGKS